MLGTLVGVLPGIGPVAGTAVLLPVTFKLPPAAGIIMLAAIYYGAMYGGTMTSVLVNVPGEAASAITCIDGYAMARRGARGPALAVAAIGSFIGGMVATLGLVLLAPPAHRLALEVRAAGVLRADAGRALAGRRPRRRSILLALLGGHRAPALMVGIDPVAGAPRFTFGASIC